MNTNEQRWQECPLEEATHARTATEEVYELHFRDGYGRFILLRDGTRHIFADVFHALGITPVRKAEVKPVEFVGTVRLIKDPCGSSSEIAIMKAPYEHVGKTFRCVEVTK